MSKTRKTLLLTLLAVLLAQITVLNALFPAQTRQNTVQNPQIAAQTGANPLQNTENPSQGVDNPSQSVDEPAAAVSLSLGSDGEAVKQMQEKLARWGYYSGEADGRFGEETRRAVTKFQRQNGLTADGVVGAQTLAALGMQSSSASASLSRDAALLARVISAEARGEPYAGQVAVGAVILNRVAHPAFPSTLAAVVYQPGAFSCLDDGQIDQPVTDSARRAAQEALAGADPSGGAIYYFNPATATSSWIWSRPLIKVIGNHRFCA